MAEKGNIDYLKFIEGFISHSATLNGFFGTKMHWYMYENFKKAMRRTTAYCNLEHKPLIHSILLDPYYIPDKETMSGRLYHCGKADRQASGTYLKKKN